MNNFFSKYKSIFYSYNVILIVLYIYPGSLLGCFLYNDCKLQPRITPDFIISSNHLYLFFFLSLVGLFTYKNLYRLKNLYLYLFLLATILEILHLIIPGRSFEFRDLFGNLLGILIAFFINHFLFKYENFKK